MWSSLAVLQYNKSINLTIGQVHRQPATYTANEGPVRIQNKYLVPIYGFPEMKLRGLVISKTEL
jgi:hypothetical protein